MPRLAAGGSAAALHRFAALWAERGRALATRRAETLLHAAAAALALGLIAGLYLRGLVFDYRVGWQSTFLTPEVAHAVVTTLLTPAALLSGIALPDVAAFAAMREGDGPATGGAPAAAWIHLLALTLLLAVALPRVLLAALARGRARWRSARFPLPLEQPYYQRLARLQRGGSARVVVFPYGAAVSPQATLGLRALLAESFGPRVALEVAPGVAFGAEDEAALAIPAGTSHAIALFDLSATPENENQGRFLRRLAAALPAGAALAVLLDESQFARRFAGMGERLAQRREAWRQWGEAHGSRPLALALERGEAAADAPARLQAALRRADGGIAMSSTDIALSLVSHTNAGKTTLARTLLREDLGEVRDAPHVTEFAEVRTMVATPEGERLLLWDTPGFGDSVRLARRLRQSSQPIGWFLSQVWDRWRDRPFWASQQAMRNVRDEADVMLYLVNAAEAPEAAGYVAPEMELLAWVGKPVIVLLNQLGPPGAPALEAAELARWRSHLASYPAVRTVLPLDAFARCWVQEATLLRAVEHALDGERRARMGRLRAAWQRRDLEVFEAAMQTIAGSLARIALAAVPLPEAGGLRAGCAAPVPGIGLGSSDGTPAVQAQEALAARARRRGARRHPGADPPARPRRQRRGEDPGPAGQPLPGAAAPRRRPGGALGRRRQRRPGRPEGRPAERRADARRRHARRGAARRARLGRPGPLRQPRPRHRIVVAVVERRGARCHRRGGAAALPGGGALRPRPRRMGRGRVAAALEGRGGGVAGAAARGAGAAVERPSAAGRRGRRRRTRSRPAGAARRARADRPRRRAREPGAPLPQRR